MIDTCNLLELFTSVGDYSSSLDGVMEKYDKIIVEIMIVSCKKCQFEHLCLHPKVDQGCVLHDLLSDLQGKGLKHMCSYLIHYDKKSALPY